MRRTWFAGYRVADADALLARFAGRISEFRGEVEALKVQLADAESRRVEIEHQLNVAVQRELDLAESVRALDVARDDMLRAAREQARTIVDDANLEAARIKGDALLQAETARAQVDELLRLRETLSSTMRAVVRDFEATVGRIDRGESPASLVSPRPAPSASEGRDVAETPAENGGDMFDGRVELEAGPFTDFAALSAFERALGSLPKIEDVYIRRFAGDRAIIDLVLLEPASLIDELTDRMPYRLNVERSGLDHIAVTVSDSG